jgi:hypothetical protein
MKKLPIVFRQIFLLLLITGLAACAGKDKQEKTPDYVTGQLRQEILKTVTDPERASQAAELADSLKQIFAESDKQYKTDFETFQSINANFDATDAELQAFFDRINSQAKNRQARVLAIHEKMRTLLTAEEWKQLNDAREDALKVDLKLL